MNTVDNIKLQISKYRSSEKSVPRYVKGAQDLASYIDNNFIKGTLLDVGCGEGLMIKELRNLGWNAFGFDADPTKIEEGISELGYMETYDYNKYDYITCIHALEHTPDPKGVMEKFMKSTSTVLVLVPYPDMNAPEEVHIGRKVIGTDQADNLVSILRFFEQFGQVEYKSTDYKEQELFIVVRK